jgi:hypothetical protein
MTRWYVWGDFVHTMPERIGSAALERRDDAAARRAADAAGFDFERRLHNGFEPWAARFASEDGENAEFAFAAYPTVRGYRKL